MSKKIISFLLRNGKVKPSLFSQWSQQIDKSKVLIKIWQYARKVRKIVSKNISKSKTDWTPVKFVGGRSLAVVFDVKYETLMHLKRVAWPRIVILFGVTL